MVSNRENIQPRGSLQIGEIPTSNSAEEWGVKQTSYLVKLDGDQYFQYLQWHCVDSLLQLLLQDSISNAFTRQEMCLYPMFLLA